MHTTEIEFRMIDGVEECAKIIKICSKLLHYQMLINRISTIQIVIFLNES